MAAENLQVVNKLLEKTKERKIEWKGTYDSTTFICAIEGEFSFEIEKGKTTSGRGFRRLTMKDREDGEVFVERAIAPSTDTSMSQDRVWDILDDLYEQARRVALDIDKKVSDVTNLLDKI
jgi:hypothetical protein